MTLGDRIVIMRDGWIQQAGRSLDLCDRPENVFVSTFIGSPEMNRLDGELFRDGGGLKVRSGELLLGLPDVEFSEIEKNVIVGIRPETLKSLKWLIDEHYIDWPHSASMNFQPVRLDIYEDPRWKKHPMFQWHWETMMQMKSFINQDSKVKLSSADLIGPSINLLPSKVFDANVMPEMLQNKVLRNMSSGDCVRGIWMFNKFDVIWLLTKGGPLNQTETLRPLPIEGRFWSSISEAGWRW
jgi:MalK-like protein